MDESIINRSVFKSIDRRALKTKCPNYGNLYLIKLYKTKVRKGTKLGH
jgi:hypothetical protein